MRAVPRWKSMLAFCGLVLLFTAGCREPDPRLRARVCGDVSVPWSVDAVRVSLLGPNRETRANPLVDLLECPEGEVRELPRSVAFDPFGGTAWAVVQGLKQGRVVLRYERRLELSADERSGVVLAANRDCLGITCPEGQTCVGGECRLAPRRGESTTNCTSTGSPRTIEDAGAMMNGDAGGSASSNGGGSSVRDPAVLCRDADAGTTADQGVADGK